MSVGAEDILPADFGKYRLVKRIATGGMAEIFLAHRHDAPRESIVIKRILPHLVKSAEFVSMFLDEARIAAQLQHPNIVRIHDIGQIAGAYYIAMEFVHGEDIRRIYNCAYKLQRSLPLSHSIRVIADAALGLSYAHKLTDFAGRPMGVVHRDVSPQNILVTYEGHVKVVDFGIAKAANKVNQTRAGVLKGKYSYMSPEQALGDPIDQRTDIFALGIILYETTTGTRLFKRHNELATLQAIIKCEILPPAEALPGYPGDLERILLKALAKHPEDRFTDAQELSEELYDFLHTSELYVEREVIAAFMKDLFKDRLEEEKGSGEPVLPHEDEVREEMADATTPMREDRRRHSTGATPSSSFEPGEKTGNADTHLRRWDEDDDASADRALGFHDSPEVDPEPTGTEADQEDLENYNLDPRVLQKPPGTPPPADRPSQIRARAVDPAAVLSQDIPATVLSARNRQRTEVIRPSMELPSPFVAPRGNGAAKADATVEESPLAPRTHTDLGAPASVEPRSVTDGNPPADMLPTVAAQPIYQPPAPAEPATAVPPPSERIPEPERSALRERAEPTEQVRARAQVASLPARDRDRERERERRRSPTATEISPSFVPRVAIVFGAVLAAVLAGIVASRLWSNYTSQPGTETVPVEQCFGRATVLTEPGATVYAGTELLGRATAQGIAGPFRVRAGQHVVRVMIEDVGFERERPLEIQCDRIHEFEIRGRKGWLSLKVQPWARVQVDGHDVGITPLPNLQLFEGTHEVRLENPDLGRRHAERVRIEAGQVRELKLNLNDAAGR